MNSNLNSPVEETRKAILLKIEVKRIKLILTGLALSSLLFTIHIYLSNRWLFTKISAVLDERYLAVPNGRTSESLVNFGPAILGSIFYALSLGAVITLMCILLVAIQIRFSSYKYTILISALCMQAAGVAYVSVQGFSLFPFLYLTILPPLVYFMTIRSIGRSSHRNGLYRLGAFLLPLLILATSWLSTYSDDIFTRLRDHFLYSNHIGRNVNDFYYKYTLYAAETIKPIHKKTIKTCFLKDVSHNSLKQAFEKKLEDTGYQVVNRSDAADIIISGDDSNITFHQDSELVYESTIARFLNHPSEVLTSVSKLTDRQVNFRKLLFFCLLFGFPLLFYYVGFSIVRILTVLILSDKQSYLATSFICLIVGIWFFIPISKATSAQIKESGIQKVLNTESWEQRIEAYKAIHDNEFQLSKFNGYHKHLVGGNVPERYWITRALAKDKNPASYYEIIYLLNDSSLNVVCQALYAIGKRGKIGDAPLLIQFINNEDNWYLQEYAYSALKELGWRNRKK